MQSEIQCFNFTLTTQYTSNFRETSSTSVIVDPYQAPPNTVKVVTVSAPYLLGALGLLCLLAAVV